MDISNRTSSESAERVNYFQTSGAQCPSSFNFSGVDRRCLRRRTLMLDQHLAPKRPPSTIARLLFMLRLLRRPASGHVGRNSLSMSHLPFNPDRDKQSMTGPPT